MVVGSPGATARNHIGLSYQCMTGGNRGALIADFPKQACSGGIFTTHHFPPLVVPLISLETYRVQANLS
jgi:hypothetical protein